MSLLLAWASLPLAGMSLPSVGASSPLAWLAFPFLVALVAAVVVPVGRRVRQARGMVTEENRAARLRRALAGRQDTAA